MLREFAAPFRAIDCRPATNPSAAADRAVAPPRRRALAFRASAAVLCGALLCGCGIKGPLRLLPPAAPAAAPADPVSSPASSESPAVTDPAAKPKP